MKVYVRTNLWQRMALVILAGVAPMAAITLAVITISINKDIDFGRWETYGLIYQRPLERLLDAIPRYQNATAANERDALRQQIDEAFSALDQAQTSVGDALQFTDAGLAARQRADANPDALRREWTQLAKTAPASDEALSQLIAHVRMAITHAGDTSNLILDPDLDSYYLMDVTLCALPQTQDRLGRLIPQVHAWIAAGETAAHAPELAAMAALLGEADLARIEGDVQTTLNEDANFYGTSPSLQANLSTAAQTYLAANQALLATLRQLSAGQPAPTPEAFDAVAWRAHAQAQTLWETAASELDQLLAIRIRAYQHKRTLSLLGAGLALILSGLVAWWFANRLQRTLRQVATNLDRSSKQLTDVIGQITNSSQTLAGSSSEQAASIEETSASLEELASMSRSNVESAQSVTQLVHDTRQAAEKGEHDMAGLTAAMTALQTSSADIAKIVKTIDEIAFQTNILALNAAVEAARAGEAGAGFAVVADEVRNLAQRSAHAAKETSAQIEAAIGHATQSANIGARVGVALHDIVGRVRQIDEAATAVATASQEQSQGVGQINIAIGQMDKVTQSTAARAEESSTAAQELGNEAEELKKAVRALVAILDGTRKVDTKR